MGFVLTVAALVLAAWLVMTLVTELRVRRTTTVELERAVLDMPIEYFQFIGLQRPSVVRFRELVERKELALLYREWPKLEKDFLTGEREAGHQGRPLIMDYLLDYRAYVRELMRRTV
jgi:hypothetical protein